MSAKRVTAQTGSRASSDRRREQVVEWVLFDDRASLEKADLTNLDLAGADLWGANFQQLNLRGSQFVRVNLFGADFRCADLRDCDFTDTSLDNVNLIGAIFNRNTRFPDNFHPELWWMVNADDEEGGLL